MKITLKMDDLARQVYVVAENEAKLNDHETLTPEHYLYAILLFDAGAHLVVGSGGDIVRLSQDLVSYFEGYRLREVMEVSSASNEFEILLAGAASFALLSDKIDVGIEDILVAMLDLEDSFAASVLKKHGVHFLKIISFLFNIPYETPYKPKAKSIDHPQPIPLEEILKQPDKVSAEGDKQEPKGNPLETYAVSMVDRAMEQGYDPLIGRHAELEDIMLLLCRRTKNNPVLVGDSGVGKTAIVEGLASRIAAGSVPPGLVSASIYHIDMGMLLAGTKYRGEFEDRLISILEAACEERHAIIYIDDIHTVIGTGSSSGNSIDAASLIKPYLGNDRLRFIGTTTFEDYKKYFERNPAIVRRFQKVDIHEPSREETMEILLGVAPKYEEHHGVKYTAEALEAAIDLTAKYVHHIRLPDKAIDALDHSGAYVAYKRLKLRRGRPYINPEDIEKAVSLMTKIPETSISADERQGLINLEARLKEQVFGQDDAIRSVVTSIKSSRLGLNDPEKPVASLLFVGATGVGKTEIARTLANTLNIQLSRFDMSEYQEPASTARLLGAAPGYVGHGDGGLLTDAVRKHPHAVLLLDEIEKAHPSILNVLLQVMDYGKLTDTQGKTADFRNIILIMTSNAGAADAARKRIGFEDKTDHTAMKTQVDKHFPPEFRNRLNKIVQFNPMSRDMALGVAKKALGVLESRLADKGITIQADEDALAHIAKQGFSTEYGAREIIRMVEGQVKDDIVECILKGLTSNIIQLSIVNEQLSIRQPLQMVQLAQKLEVVMQ
ncbi:MAG: AAA family ATPase [Defluviitaleaceae bacterium]|nr:AAA family ATPase [Defluviitaleaceae bacterium]